MMTLVSYILKNHTTKEVITTTSFSDIEKYRAEGFTDVETVYSPVDMYDKRNPDKIALDKFMNDRYDKFVDKAGRITWKRKVAMA